MAQIQIDIASSEDEVRFQRTLGQTVDYMMSHPNADGSMISVRTDRRIDHMTKTVSCRTPSVLTFFARVFDGDMSYA